MVSTMGVASMDHGGLATAWMVTTYLVEEEDDQSLDSLTAPQKPEISPRLISLSHWERSNGL